MLNSPLITTHPISLPKTLILTNIWAIMYARKPYYSP